MHILSLLEPEQLQDYLTDIEKGKLEEKAQKETNCVIIRQYCRIIAKFINRAHAGRLIDKIVEIVRSDDSQNTDNNETYFNYYGGKNAACNAFIKHP